MNREKRSVTQRLFFKILAFFLAVLTMLCTAASFIAIGFCAEYGVYSKPKEDILTEAYDYLCHDIYITAGSLVASGFYNDAEGFLEDYNILGLSMRSALHHWTYGDISGKGAIAFDYDWFYYSEYYYYDDNYSYLPTGDSNDYYYIHVYVDKTPEKPDDFLLAFKAVNVAYALRYKLLIAGAASLLCFIALFVFLLISSGRRAGHSEPQPGWGTKIPFDVLTAAFALFIFAGFHLLAELSYSLSGISFLIVLLIAFIAVSTVLLGWCMSLALRVKLGCLIRKTLIYIVVSFIIKTLKSTFAAVKKFASKLPLVWKTALSFAALIIIEGIVMGLCIESREYDIITLLWVIESAVLFFIVICIALMLKKLKSAGEALAAGDYSYRTDSEHLIGDFKEHAENLNNAAGGMVLAVNEKMRSERLKTELITNVSHDLKTPLTSIINYTDLICRSGCEDETVAGYAEVLHRQSEKLKRLIDDLVEASKASTGNLEMQLEECRPGVMMTQAAGEYASRLEQAGLTLVLRGAEEDITIMADGRRLWRVFDNLMNNICKYAQCGTRVYLGLERAENSAVISFKNTSREALNLTAEEFMERFVQGDISRSSDGNGLGLSIARSLTQLQKGNFDLTVDGDLFKVTLTFPIH